MIKNILLAMAFVFITNCYAEDCPAGTNTIRFVNNGWFSVYVNYLSQGNPKRVYLHGWGGSHILCVDPGHDLKCDIVAGKSKTIATTNDAVQECTIKGGTLTPRGSCSAL